MTAQLQLARGGDVPIVRIVGEVDMANVHTLRSELLTFAPNTALGLVLDLAETSYMDSQGLHLVLRLAESLEAHGQRLRIAVPEDSHVRRLFEIAHVGEQVPLDVSPRDAADAIFGRRAALWHDD